MKKGRVIGLAVLALIVFSASGLYLSLMLGLIQWEYRPWMTSADYDFAIFFDFMEKSGVPLKDAELHSRKKYTGCVFIGNPAGMDMEKLTSLLPEQNGDDPAKLIIFPVILRSDKKGKQKDKPFFTVGEFSYSILPEDETLSFYVLKDGTVKFLNPGLELLETDQGTRFISNPGIISGFDIFVFHGINIIQNGHMRSEANFHLLYNTLSPVMNDGTWLVFFGDEQNPAEEVSLSQPLKILFTGPRLFFTISVLILLLFLMVRRGYRLGPVKQPGNNEIHMLDTALENTASFWMRFNGPNAADEADRDRFLEDLTRINSRVTDGKKQTDPETAVKTFPVLEQHRNLFVPSRKKLHAKTVRNRIQTRNRIITQIERMTVI